MKLLVLPVFVALLGVVTLVTPEGVARPSLRIVASDNHSVIKDSVKKTRDDDEGIVVMLGKSQGNYYLRRTHSGFDPLSKKIKTSEKSGAVVSITADKELNIIDVK